MQKKIIDRFRRFPLTLLVFCGIMLLGWGIRELYGYNRPWPGRDEVYYMNCGLKLRADRSQEPELRQPVLLFWVISRLPNGALPQDDMRIARAFIRWWSLLFLPPFWLMGRLLFRSRRGAALLMLLAALAPFALEISNSVLREGLFLPVCGWMLLLLLLIGQNPRGWWFLLFGAAIGLGMTMRKEALEWFIFLLIPTSVLLYRKKLTWHRSFMNWGAAVAGMAVVYIGVNLLCGVHVEQFYRLADGFLAYL